MGCSPGPVEELEELLKVFGISDNRLMQFQLYLSSDELINFMSGPWAETSNLHPDPHEVAALFDLPDGTRNLVNFHRGAPTSGEPLRVEELERHFINFEEEQGAPTAPYLNDDSQEDSEVDENDRADHYRPQCIAGQEQPLDLSIKIIQVDGAYSDLDSEPEESWDSEQPAVKDEEEEDEVAELTNQLRRRCYTGLGNSEVQHPQEDRKGVWYKICRRPDTPTVDEKAHHLRKRTNKKGRRSRGPGRSHLDGRRDVDDWTSYFVTGTNRKPALGLSHLPEDEHGEAEAYMRHSCDPDKPCSCRRPVSSHVCQSAASNIDEDRETPVASALGRYDQPIDEKARIANAIYPTSYLLITPEGKKQRFTYDGRPMNSRGLPVFTPEELELLKQPNGFSKMPDITRDCYGRRYEDYPKLTRDLLLFAAGPSCDTS